MIAIKLASDNCKLLLSIMILYKLCNNYNGSIAMEQYIVHCFNAGSCRQSMFEVRLGMGLTQTEKAVASRKISIFLGVLLSFYSEK